MASNDAITPSIDTYSTAVHWNDSLFDDVIDPFQQIAISERGDGQEAGRRAGYLEGRDIGRSKGWEIGLELGYIHSFASNLLAGHNQREQIKYASTPGDRSNQRLDRCMTISKELIDLVNSFPNPDELLAQNANITNNIDAIKASEDDATNDSAADQDASLTDVTSSLQRIRAKFKLLLVLMRTNTPLDLKRLLNANDRDSKTDKSNDDVSQQATLQKGGDW